MCPWGGKSEPVGDGPRITHPPKTDLLTVLEFNQILDLIFDASELDFGALRTSKSSPFWSKSQLFPKKLTFTIYSFFQYKINILPPLRGPWSAKNSI